MISKCSYDPTQYNPNIALYSLFIVNSISMPSEIVLYKDMNIANIERHG